MDRRLQPNISRNSSVSALRSNRSLRMKSGRCRWCSWWIRSCRRRSPKSRSRIPSSKSKETGLRKHHASPVARHYATEKEQSMTPAPAAVRAYYLPQPSHWPITGACALLLRTSGAATWINRGAAGPYVLAAGMALLVYMLFGWFGAVIRESEAGLYNRQVDVSYRWAMAWFIFSETMFFAAFFGALFYLRWHAVPDLASGDTAELWPGFKGGWPATGPGIEGTFRPGHASGIPLINTLLLLTSAATLLLAHSGLQKRARGQLQLGLF